MATPGNALTQRFIDKIDELTEKLKKITLSDVETNLLLHARYTVMETLKNSLLAAKNEEAVKAAITKAAKDNILFTRSHTENPNANLIQRSESKFDTKSPEQLMKMLTLDASHHELGAELASQAYLGEYHDLLMEFATLKRFDIVPDVEATTGMKLSVNRSIHDKAKEEKPDFDFIKKKILHSLVGLHQYKSGQLTSTASQLWTSLGAIAAKVGVTKKNKLRDTTLEQTRLEITRNAAKDIFEAKDLNDLTNAINKALLENKRITPKDRKPGRLDEKLRDLAVQFKLNIVKPGVEQLELTDVKSTDQTPKL